MLVSADVTITRKKTAPLVSYALLLEFHVTDLMSVVPTLTPVIVTEGCPKIGVVAPEKLTIPKVLACQCLSRFIPCTPPKNG